MGRGEAKAISNKTQGIGTEELAGATELEKKNIIPGYEQAMSGVPAGERSAIETSAMGASAQPFDAASQEAERRGARTLNTAGIAAQQDALARAKGETMGKTAGDVEEQIGQLDFSRKMQGLSGLQQLYGTKTGAMESMYGLQPQLLAQENASPWWMPLATSAIGAAGAGLTGGLSGLGKAASFRPGQEGYEG